MLGKSVTLKLFVLITFLLITTAFFVIFIPHIKDKTKFNLVEPTSGNFVQTYKIDITFDNQKDIAMTNIKDISNTTIKQNQNVILYDKDSNVLPLAGKIAFIRKSPEELNILIALPKETDTTLLSNKAAIITMDVPTLKLLPKKVLQTDIDGNNFIWIAQKESGDKYKFSKQPFTLIYSNDDYIALSQNLGENTFVLINPSETIKTDKTYNANMKLFETSRYNPIYTAWLQYIEQKNKDGKVQMAENLENCLNKNAPTGTTSIAQPTTGVNSSICGNNSGNIISAEEIFARIDQQGQSSNSCGSNSCGQ